MGKRIFKHKTRENVGLWLCLKLESITEIISRIIFTLRQIYHIPLLSQVRRLQKNRVALLLEGEGGGRSWPYQYIVNMILL